MGLKASSQFINVVKKTCMRSPLELEAIKRGVRKENIDIITDLDSVLYLEGVSTAPSACLSDVFTFMPKENFPSNIDNFFRFSHRSFRKEIEKLNDKNLTSWYEEMLLKIKQTFKLKKLSINEDKIKEFYKLLSNRKVDETALLSKSNKEIEEIIFETFPSLKQSKYNSEIADNLKKIMNAEEYAKLSDKNKFTIKIATVMAHCEDEASIKSLLDKLQIPEEMKINIWKMFIPHNADSLALDFTNNNERLMTKIFKKHLFNKDIPLSDLKKAEELANELDKTGIALFGTPLSKGKNLARIPIERGTDGFEYPVLNLHKIKGDMTKYGFPGIKPEEFTVDATFLSSINEAEVVDAIARHIESPYRRLCTTKIGLGQNGTFQNRKIGIPIEADSRRRYEFALSHDLETSGNNYRPNVSAVLKKGQESEIQRTFISVLIKYRLKHYGLKINDEQYAELFSQIADKRYLTQIKTLTLDGKELSKAETEKIISVIKEVQSKIVNKGNTLVKNPPHDYSSPEWAHNETIIRGGIINKNFILYKADNLSQVDESVLKYVRENNKYLILV